MTENRWIVIPNWEKFQHYGLARRPLWIKNYTALLHKKEYLDLSLAERGLLHTIWLAYAESGGRLRESDVRNFRTTFARLSHFEALNHAGLIEFSASAPLYLKERKLPDTKKSRQSALTRFVCQYWDEYPDKSVLMDELRDRGAETGEAGELIEQEKRRRGAP